MAEHEHPGLLRALWWRGTGWCLHHIGPLIGSCLVAWLLFLAVLALMLLPGCSSDEHQVDERERYAFTLAERIVIESAHELAAGAITPDKFVTDIHDMLDALREGEKAERESARMSLEEVIGIALGSSTAVGVGLNMLRNRSRRRTLEEFAEEFEPRAKSEGLQL